MNRQTLLSTFARGLAAVACLAVSASCGSELLRTGRAPVYLVILDMAGTNGSIVRSDVLDPAGIAVDDIATANISSEAKNQDAATSPINAVTLTRYRVTFRRTDGRNTPGVDVPYGFDGGLSVTIPAGGSSPVPFQIVRQQSKLEPPLRNLIGGGGLIVISTIAEVTFYGRDQNGNEVVVTGNMDVQFGDF
jgi:hypothetical protein